MVRVKRRYFVFQFHFNSNSSNIIKSSHIHTAFETIITRLYGDLGIARFTRNLSIIYYNPLTHISIVRCLRDDKHILQTAATFISKLTNDQIECSIQTLHVGGSIRQCKKYLVKYSIEQLLFINSQLIHQNKTITSKILFQKKKKKGNNQQHFMDIHREKQLALQKLLNDSRIESNSIILSKNDDHDDDLGKRKQNDQ